MKKPEQLKKWDYNFKREYECKLCHKMNRSSYICADCRNALQGITKTKRGVSVKRKENRCIDCNCVIVRRGLTAKRCRDCTAVNNQLRYSLYKKVEFVDYKINQLQTAKELSFGSKRRLENLLLSRQHLMGRIQATYLYDKRGGINIPQSKR